MKIGMLWLDADPSRKVTERIADAAAYYSKKYGRSPTLCLLHPATAGDALPARLDGLELRTSPAVLREHMWIGVGEASTAAA
jgi:hypothetical protein